MQFTTAGLVLREAVYRDSSKMLTLMTPRRGVISAKARGVLRKNSPLMAGCQLFGLSEFTLFESAGRLTVEKADPVELFEGLRADLEKLSLAAYFGEVSESFAKNDSEDDAAFRLLLNMLFALCYRNDPAWAVKSAFEFRAASEGGYAPSLSACALCGLAADEGSMLFSVTSGRLVCSDCHAASRTEAVDGEFCPVDISVPVDGGQLALLDHLVLCPAKQLLRFPVSLDGARAAALSDLTEAYLLTRLERSVKSLQYYKKISPGFAP